MEKIYLSLPEPKRREIDKLEKGQRIAKLRKIQKEEEKLNQIYDNLPSSEKEKLNKLSKQEKIEKLEEIKEQ